MTITVFPSELNGIVKAIPSKSAAHRGLICECLAGACDIVACDGTSDDIEATKRCLAEISKTNPVLNCGESGSTFRFMLPIVMALGLDATFILEGRLPERTGYPAKFGIHEQLKPGIQSIEGGKTSQYISGMLFALPLLDGDSQLHITGRFESKPYVDLTVDMLKKFGINVDFADNVFYVRGNQVYKPPEQFTIEGDWSNSAFWLVAGSLSGKSVTVTGLDMQSKQGDKAIVKLLQEFDDNKSGVMEIDVRDIPDLVPILAVRAAGWNGVTTIRNAGRLRIKESDRLQAMVDTLTSIGAKVEQSHDELRVYGSEFKLDNGGLFPLNSYNDHRIVMSAAIAATCLCKEPVTIEAAEAVEKSYPGFFEDLKSLGGKFKIK
ncbi:MAG: 3-phosphoshikimate 1-carboxyvinyltransferase [Oscillospiraceae bacterium]|nr:3-phosphoshikimate 1-carboxyvinyltransferase [Oscillospiraceae bacterium]